ncbi:MAG TPA: hypothetical protein VJZ93_04240 [Candidatus Nanoarchaeia archaeon]|nr:hypothetical protein [Candidatus Nanoarchaeia archaeon]
MEKDIGRIRKNDTTDVIIRVDDFGGRKGVTIREFVTSDRYTGFTKSGVRILSEDFPKFREMLNSIKKEDLEENIKKDSGQEDLRSNEDNEEMPDY